MEKIIKVTNLTKQFTSYKKEPGLKGSIRSLFIRKPIINKAVDNISFSIKEGEIVGFLGPNGAGKTTTLKLLSGLLKPTAGSIEVLGFDPFQRKSDYLKQISLVMGQKNQLWWDIPPIETFRLNREIYDISNQDFEQTLKELVALLGVEKVIYKQSRKLSLGERMKCEVIAALVHKPKVLYLDEPTIGLDISMQKKLRQFILEYNKRHKATIMLTSHNMDDVKEVCERIIMINKGGIIYDGDIKDLKLKAGNYKLITIYANEPLLREKLEGLGQIISFEPLKAVIRTEGNNIPQKVESILKGSDIDDIDINEPKLEDIILELGYI